VPAVFFDGRHYISQHLPPAGNQVTADHKSKSITINLSSDSCQSDVKSESESYKYKYIYQSCSSDKKLWAEMWYVHVVDIKVRHVLKFAHFTFSAQSEPFIMCWFAPRIRFSVGLCFSFDVWHFCVPLKCENLDNYSRCDVKEKCILFYNFLFYFMA